MRLLQSMIESSALHRPPIFAVLKSLLVLKPTDGAHSILDMKKNAIECCVFLMAQVENIDTTDMPAREHHALNDKSGSLAALAHMCGFPAMAVVSQGFVMPVLDYIQTLIQDMDHALIRHFFGTKHARP
jgi:hypothetical protein